MGCLGGESRWLPRGGQRILHFLRVSRNPHQQEQKGGYQLLKIYSQNNRNEFGGRIRVESESESSTDDKELKTKKLRLKNSSVF